MADSVIFQMQGDRLVEMREQPYDTEALLQDLLSNYPSLLAGDQIDQTEPRRWLLVRPEISVPDQLNGTGRWALDHLFLDQDARPTFVEVKRSSDTRIRREVIGQMLDYAANATAYWPAERLRVEFENRCRQNGDDPDQRVVELWGDEVDAFWARAAENLQEGRLRLLFVADVLPPELRRVIEFLNTAFEAIEVLGIEIKQYKGEDAFALVPRVIGQTVKIQDKKIPKPSNRKETWTLESFSENLTVKGLAHVARALRSLVDFAKRHDLIYTYTKSGTLMLRPVGKSANLFYFYSEGTFNINSTELKDNPPFNDNEQYGRLKGLFGQLISVDGPSIEKFKIENLREDHDEALDIFLRTLFGVPQD